MNAETAAMQDAEARRSIKEELARANCRVHQPDDPPLFTREPRSEMKTVHWRWTELWPLLERIGREMAIGSGGQRRTLRLANPGLPYGTTHTFWASIQVILPGEIADAHRHTANAFRFVMKGSGATTTVDGERVVMNEGDLVLTPGGTWHDHEYRGAEPMIWLDVLDISLVRSMHATFFEPYAQQVQPVKTSPAQSALSFPLAAAEARLAPDPYEDLVQEYAGPGGGPAMATFAMKLARLRLGFEGRARRYTGSKVCYVVRGSGETEVEGERYAWNQGDFLAIAPWAWHRHRVPAGGADALLFEVDDTPALRALGYYREESR